MLDASGPWGTAPFILSEGYSSIENKIAIITRKPFACTWLTEAEDRTSVVRLEANPNYWNKKRGPRIERVVFRNDLSPEQALELCTSTEGHVDIVTDVEPADASGVVSSACAKLISVDANQVLAGTFNRFAKDSSFHDRRLREAFNLSVNRENVIAKGFLGYANTIAAMTPSWAKDFPEELKPRPYDPAKARQLFREAGGWPSGRVLEIAATEKYGSPARLIANDIKNVLRIDTKVKIIPESSKNKWLRVAAEKKLLPNWDILLVDTFALFSEATPAFIHREYFGADGAYRAGPKFETFDQLYAQMASETDPDQLILKAKQIDRYVYHESLALFLIAPKKLYAVNRHVNFQPYRSTFELAETEVNNQHWSRRT
ncbi:ABC transporter substrate-binding protein [Peribacillus cavernae]|uniref:ABC transporter substrate-binding protein n=1 Tax=Peribacillus cavernae TaxID=1674310 RepID=A0A433HJN2_9BACI|nr:ABC transporter substrate-binding protein [Peribacillus cavernae]MDQ0219175.1 peptide/nickel transport system substrate-binding protein [Peribacillus cavernae]RUQ28600.1 ABC transporter substrate-binding protein [Peribacillus cavernae]